jgi:hypothetical protein
LSAIEQSDKKRRIARVWHPNADVDLWHGTYGSAPVEPGYVAYQWNNGEICE